MSLNLILPLQKPALTSTGLEILEAGFTILMRVLVRAVTFVIFFSQVKLPDDLFKIKLVNSLKVKITVFIFENDMFGATP